MPRLKLVWRRTNLLKPQIQIDRIQLADCLVREPAKAGRILRNTDKWRKDNE